MMTIEPIRKQVTVQASPEKAFEVFTDGMSRWWNPDYHIGAEPYARTVMEPRAGGRWFETGESGGECDWGRVLVWEPPHRVVLEWQISATWRFDPDVHTEIDVRFLSDGDRTRVELEHRGLESFGADAEMMRGIFDTPTGWAGLLERFGAEAGG
jgi:uncharacterized protein YndB with AHSA1/START domain